MNELLKNLCYQVETCSDGVGSLPRLREIAKEVVESGVGKGVPAHETFRHHVQRITDAQRNFYGCDVHHMCVALLRG